MSNNRDKKIAKINAYKNLAKKKLSLGKSIDEEVSKEIQSEFDFWVDQQQALLLGEWQPVEKDENPLKDLNKSQIAVLKEFANRMLERGGAPQQQQTEGSPGAEPLMPEKDPSIPVNRRVGRIKKAKNIDDQLAQLEAMDKSGPEY